MTSTAISAGNTSANAAATAMAAASPTASRLAPARLAMTTTGITGNSVQTLPTSVKYSIPGGAASRPWARASAIIVR